MSSGVPTPSRVQTQGCLPGTGKKTNTQIFLDHQEQGSKQITRILWICDFGVGKKRPKKSKIKLKLNRINFILKSN